MLLELLTVLPEEVITRPHFQFYTEIVAFSSHFANNRHLLLELLLCVWPGAGLCPACVRSSSLLLLYYLYLFVLISRCWVSSMAVVNAHLSCLFKRKSPCCAVFLICFHYYYYYFYRECCSCCRFQPYDCIIIHFVE